MALITSQHNQSVRALRCLRGRKERDQTGLFLVEGLRAVRQAVQAGLPISRLVVAPELLTSAGGQMLVEELRRAGTPCLEVAAEVFASVAGKDGFQGIAAVLAQRWWPLPNGPLLSDEWWVGLAEAGYPGNLGAVLRTCDATGAAGAILLGQTADPYAPAAVRASLGAVLTQRLVRATRDEFLAWRRRHGVTVVGTSPAAPASYRATVYRPPLVLLLGSERQGLGPAYQDACDITVSIPMVGHGDSLNLGVAAGIVLYEIFAQQRAGPPATPRAAVSDE
jgi:TrmH family RNA methyltransferase